MSLIPPVSPMDAPSLPIVMFCSPWLLSGGERYTEKKFTFVRSTNFVLQAETRAEFAERSVQKLQKEVDRLEGLLSMFRL